MTSVIKASNEAVNRALGKQIGRKRKIAEFPNTTITADGHKIDVKDTLRGDHLPYLLSIPCKTTHTTDSFATSANKELDFELFYMPDYKIKDRNSIWLQMPFQESGGSNSVIPNFIEAGFDYRRSVVFIQNGKPVWESNLGQMLYEPAMSMSQNEYENYCRNVNHDANLDPLSCNKFVIGKGTGGINEIQVIKVQQASPNGATGLFGFSFMGETTPHFTTTTGTVQNVQSALNALPSMRKRGLTVMLGTYGAAGTNTPYTGGTDKVFDPTTALVAGDFIQFTFYPAEPVFDKIILISSMEVDVTHQQGSQIASYNSSGGGTIGGYATRIFYLRLPNPFSSRGLWLGTIKADQPLILRIRTQNLNKGIASGTLAINTNPDLNLLLQVDHIPLADQDDYAAYFNNRRWNTHQVYLFEPPSATVLTYSGKSPRIKIDTLQDVICDKAIGLVHVGRGFSSMTNVGGGYLAGEELNNGTSTNYFSLIKLGTSASPAQIWFESANGIQAFTSNGKYVKYMQDVEMLKKGDTKLYQNSPLLFWDFGDYLHSHYTGQIEGLFKFSGEDYLVIQDSGIGTGAFTSSVNQPVVGNGTTTAGFWPGASAGVFIDIYAWSPIQMQFNGGVLEKYMA